MKTVWITGSASGLGLALTDSFIQRGHKVIATDINLEGLKIHAEKRSWPLERVLLRKLDVTSKTQWEAIAAEVSELDLMINNAGYLRPGYVKDFSEADLHRHMDINVKGVCLGSQMAAQKMLKQGHGHILNIGSMASLAPISGISLYSASKFAVRGFTLALGQELAPHGVAVTILCPDAIRTPMLDLQVDFEEAAMTFSGSRSLRTEEVVNIIHEKILKDRPLEVMLPLSRGLLAKIANAFPGLSMLLLSGLRKKGLKKQAQLRK